MQLKLVVDKGPFDLALQRCCLIIAIFYLVCFTIGAIFVPAFLTYASSLVGFIIALVGNICLLLGALWFNRWLVFVWLINALLYFIGWPIGFLGVIFNYGGYRQGAYFDNIFLILLEYVINLLVFAYLARLVYSFFAQLRNSESNPQHAVVV